MEAVILGLMVFEEDGEDPCVEEAVIGKLVDVGEREGEIEIAFPITQKNIRVYIRLNTLDLLKLVLQS